MYSTIIKNGKIIDGSGAEPFYADVAINDGKIVKIGSISGQAKTVIDAEGLTVTPGFIDSHSHADYDVFTLSHMKEKVEQGITTAIAGQCGESVAPLSRDYDKSKAYTIDGYGTNYEIYKTMDTFLERGSSVPLGCNIATFIGHGTIRTAVMGMENREPTEKELDEMKAILRRALKMGVYGMSTGLYYAPGSYAKENEVIELARVTAEEGGVVSSHIRGESNIVLDAADEFLKIVKASGVRGVHSHIKSCGEKNFGKVKILLDNIDKANCEGFDVYCDVYPYNASHTSLASSFVPRELHSDGKLLENLRDRQKREISKEYIEKIFGRTDLSWALVTSAQNRPDCVGKRVSQIAKECGTDPYDTVFDIILDSNNRASACYFRMNEKDVETAIKHHRAMICTDSGVAKSNSYHPRLRASFPRAISRYSIRNGLVALPEMIRKITSLPAAVYGLSEKGMIKEGYDADICIFDEEKLIDRSDFANPTLACEGLDYVLVSGEIAARNAVSTGVLAGKLLRKNH